MGEHTPGPWHWEAHDVSMATLGGEDIMTDHVLSVGPCKACQHRAEPQEWTWGRCTTPTQANARLISAAPELLAILKIIVARADPADRYLREPIATACAIIAQAEGRS